MICVLRFYPDPALLCRAGLGTPFIFLLMLRTSPLKGGSDNLKRVIVRDRLHVKGFEVG